MEQKRVSFKVAKAIKEARYPLHKVGVYDGITPIMYDEEHNEENWADCDAWYLPTYLDVWLWLWRVKKIYILLNSGAVVSIQGIDLIWHIVYQNNHSDPEEAIVAAIDYLVDSDLIK